MITTAEVNAAIKLGIKVIPPMGTQFSFCYNLEVLSQTYVVREFSDGRVRYTYCGYETASSSVSLDYWLSKCVVTKLSPVCPPLDQWVRVE